MAHGFKQRSLCATVLNSLVALLWLHVGATGKRVMFMPTPATTHAIHHVQVARALVDLGHESWLVLPSHVTATGFLSLQGLHVIEYEALNFVKDVLHPTVLQPLLQGTSPDYNDYIKRRMEMNEGILTNQELYKKMEVIRPDLFVYDEAWTGAKMFAVFSYRMGVPFAAIDFAFEPYGRRVPFSPAVTPSIIHPFADHMSLVERIQNTLFYLSELTGSPFTYSDAVARYAPEMPYVSLDTLNARAEVWLVQSEHILDYPKPTLPNVKLIGGIAASPAKELPPLYKAFMDEAPEGVVIASFGSMLYGLPKHIGEGLLLDVFLRLPMKVIFRSNLTSPDPTKIMTSSWLPQNDLLGHPNARVFLTHCGNSGQYQALYHAVPMVGLPFRYDQFYNAQRMQVKGYGKVVHLQSLTRSELENAILEVVKDPSYEQNISRSSRIFREQFGVPAERAAYWIDHVMQYGGGYMRSAGQEMPLYQFLLLDVMAVFAVTTFLCVILTCSISWWLLKRLYQKKSKLE